MDNNNDSGKYKHGYFIVTEAMLNPELWDATAFVRNLNLDYGEGRSDKDCCETAPAENQHSVSPIWNIPLKNDTQENINEKFGAYFDSFMQIHLDTGLHTLEYHAELRANAIANWYRIDENGDIKMKPKKECNFPVSLY